MNSSNFKNRMSANVDVIFINAYSPEVSLEQRIYDQESKQLFSASLSNFFFFFMRNRNLIFRGHSGPKHEKMTLIGFS